MELQRLQVTSWNYSNGFQWCILVLRLAPRFVSALFLWGAKGSSSRTPTTEGAVGRRTADVFSAAELVLKGCKMYRHGSSTHFRDNLGDPSAFWPICLIALFTTADPQVPVLPDWPRPHSLHLISLWQFGRGSRWCWLQVIQLLRWIFSIDSAWLLWVVVIFVGGLARKVNLGTWRPSWEAPDPPPGDRV